MARTRRRLRWGRTLWRLAAVGVAAWVALGGHGPLRGTWWDSLGAATGTAAPVAPELSPPGAWQPGSEDIDMAAAVLLRPDEGTGGTTVRWAGPTVTYRIDLPGYDAAHVERVREVMRWAASRAGLEVVEVTSGAQIDVVAQAGNGAHVSGTVDGSGALVHVRFSLGCCRVRPVWEDGLQAFGPMGDQADARSVFSADLSRQAPGDFDAWVLTALYSVPPGADEATVRAALAATRP